VDREALRQVADEDDDDGDGDDDVDSSSRASGIVSTWAMMRWSCLWIVKPSGRSQILRPISRNRSTCTPVSRMRDS
jgi:hypothetical protein